MDDQKDKSIHLINPDLDFYYILHSIFQEERKNLYKFMNLCNEV